MNRLTVVRFVQFATYHHSTDTSSFRRLERPCHFVGVVKRRHSDDVSKRNCCREPCNETDTWQTLQATAVAIFTGARQLVCGSELPGVDCARSPPGSRHLSITRPWSGRIFFAITSENCISLIGLFVLIIYSFIHLDLLFAATFAKGTNLADPQPNVPRFVIALPSPDAQSVESTAIYNIQRHQLRIYT